MTAPHMELKEETVIKLMPMLIAAEARKNIYPKLPAGWNTQFEGDILTCGAFVKANGAQLHVGRLVVAEATIDSSEWNAINGKQCRIKDVAEKYVDVLASKIWNCMMTDGDVSAPIIMGRPAVFACNYISSSMTHDPSSGDMRIVIHFVYGVRE